MSLFRSVGNPVDCPECGRHFKNNKALNGHMRLHGGFDWTRRVCRVCNLVLVHYQVVMLPAGTSLFNAHTLHIKES